MAKIKQWQRWTSNQIMSDTNFQIDHYSNKDFKTVQLHSHDFFELYYFVSGKASYIVENDKYTLRPNDILLIPPNSLHQLDIQDSSMTYERYVLWLNPNYINSLSTENSSLKTCFDYCKSNHYFLVRDKQVSTIVYALMQDLINADSENAFASDISCNIIISKILITLSRFFIDSMNEILPSHNKNTQISRINHILRYIDENIEGDLSLDSIAEQMFISKYYLTRLFTQATGTTLHKYILKRRLILAKSLIASDYPITEVYKKAGFGDYSHFFRAFKNEYGMTPKEYRALI